MTNAAELKIESMKIAEVESRIMLNCYCQADSIKIFNNVKSDTKEHLDIHKLTASKMFNVPYDEVTDEQRRMAKTLNFRKLYTKEDL